MSLIQDKYINNIFSKFNITKHQNNLAPLPSNWNAKEDKPLKELIPTPSSYHGLVGLLQWPVQCTRTELAFTASCLSQFLEKPQKMHYQDRIHVLNYLNNTRHYNLDLGTSNLKSGPNERVGFSNANHGGAKEAKFYSGSLIYFHSLFGWQSHIQKLTTLSLAKSKLVSLVECARDLMLASNILEETIQLKLTLELSNNNQSTIAICKNEFYNHGTRHILFKFYFMCDIIKSRQFNLSYMPTCNLPEELMTKNLMGD